MPAAIGLRKWRRFIVDWEQPDSIGIHRRSQVEILAKARRPFHSGAVSQPYLSLEAEFHDAFWAADDDASEVALMADFLRKSPGKALEIGSGSGRLLFPLIDLGFDVEGLELSPDMLAICKNQAAERSVDTALHQGDMSHWQPAAKYSALLAPAFTFQLASDPLATLRHWRGLLENGGGLYITLFIPFMELEGELEENAWYLDHETTLPGGRIAVLDTRHKIDPEKQILEREHRYYFADHPAESHSSRQTLRWFTHDQFTALLEEAGFQVTAAFADFDPGQKVTSSESLDFDGILTYHATVHGL